MGRELKLGIWKGQIGGYVLTIMMNQERTVTTEIPRRTSGCHDTNTKHLPRHGISKVRPTFNAYG